MKPYHFMICLNFAHIFICFVLISSTLSNEQPSGLRLATTQLACISTKSSQSLCWRRKASLWSWLVEPADRILKIYKRAPIRGLIWSCIFVYLYPYEVGYTFWNILEVPVPACSGTLVEKGCPAWENEYRACSLGDGTTVIDFAVVAELWYISTCEFFDGNYLDYNSTNGVYGYTKNILWVDNGCQATFYVCLGIVA